jgi:hypothetical protein
MYILRIKIIIYLSIIIIITNSNTNIIKYINNKSIVKIIP